MPSNIICPVWRCGFSPSATWAPSLSLHRRFPFPLHVPLPFPLDKAVCRFPLHRRFPTCGNLRYFIAHRRLSVSFPFNVSLPDIGPCKQSFHSCADFNSLLPRPLYSCHVTFCTTCQSSCVGNWMSIVGLQRDPCTMLLQEGLLEDCGFTRGSF